MFRPVVTGLARQRATVNAVQRRNFGAAPKQDWEGIDKVVRDVFPEDHQLAIAILGGYAGIAVLFKIKGAMSK